MTNKVEYKKCIVVTTGNFELLDLSTLPQPTNIKANRPTVTIRTEFIDAERSKGTLKIVAIGLPMNASDEEFGELFYEDAKKNSELAIKSYCAKFKLNVEGDKIQTEE